MIRREFRNKLTAAGDCGGQPWQLRLGTAEQQTEHRWGQELGLRNNSDSDPDLII